MSPTRILALATFLFAACAGTRSLPPAPPSAPPVAETESTYDAMQAEVDALVLRLFNEDEDVRVRAADRLGELGADARAALPYLRDCARLNVGAPKQSCVDAVIRINEAT